MGFRGGAFVRDSGIAVGFGDLGRVLKGELGFAAVMLLLPLRSEAASMPNLVGALVQLNASYKHVLSWLALDWSLAL